ncbi:MAG: amylo-alpha-1,6-glucosidase [Actinomycetia bacterium]|nr:amylo-alpha-1,6-glucosidase [Actinomycetes bacterium]
MPEPAGHGDGSGVPQPAPQPLLHDASVQLAAPTQAWSRRDGDMGAAPIDGVYHCDTRVLDRLDLLVDGVTPEFLAEARITAGETVFLTLARGRPGEGADPRLRLSRRRRVRPGLVEETIRLDSALPQPYRGELSLAVHLDATSIVALKSGFLATHDVEITGTGDTVTWSRDAVSASLTAPGATLSRDGQTVTLRWAVDLPAGGTTEVGWHLTAAHATAVLEAPRDDPGWAVDRVPTASPDLRRWITRSLDDLASLRLTPRGRTEAILGAGAPWFLTLFGRDSLITALFLLPFDPRVALDTLHVLAGFQGTRVDPVTGEQPGKIPHELRNVSADVTFGLPPLYYGTIDATPLWLVLLHETWRAGVGDDAVRPLLGAAHAALAWMRDDGAGNDGFIRYQGDGHGLANQGWKDSGDAIRWHDGSLAHPPIALPEVQAYAYRAALGGAELLEHFGPDDPAPWRAWAAALKARFRARFWIDDPAGAYPALALDGAGRPVDAVASNMGHLLGSGLVDAGEARLIADRLIGGGLNSGFGLRTLSRDEAAYWPLGYHIGSVWPHDTTIAVLGLVKEGLPDHARVLADGLARAARGFDWQLPELWSGDGTDVTPRPVPYPAACHPLTWAAAAPLALAYALPGWPCDA